MSTMLLSDMPSLAGLAGGALVEAPHVENHTITKVGEQRSQLVTVDCQKLLI